VIAHDGKTGRVVAAGDRDVLAAALAEMLSDRAGQERMGAAARQEAVERFTVQRAADRVEELYRRILAETPEVCR
jgi:glycosyltransferase involved in cell wall biosynthesis